MLSRKSRIFLLNMKISSRYAPSLREQSVILEETIQEVGRAERKSWLKRSLEILREEQEGVCPFCPEKLTDQSHVDHKVPLARGGDNSLHNLQLAHPHCNLEKSDTCDPDEVIRNLWSRLQNR